MAEKRRETLRLEGIDDPVGAEMNGAGTRIAGERRSRRRIGILSYSSPGHYYPLTALGRRLRSRGHEVVYFQVADLEPPIRAAGLEFRQIGREDFPPGRSSIEAADGLNRAADLIGSAFGPAWSARPSKVGRHARAGSDRPHDLR